MRNIVSLVIVVVSRTGLATDGDRFVESRFQILLHW